MKIKILLVVVLLFGIVGAAVATETHVMQKGDTLWDLAAKYYGDPSLYPLLLQVNRIDNPRTIANGRTIIIPDKSEMSKIALEKDITRKESMIEKIASSADNANKDAKDNGSNTNQDNKNKNSNVNNNANDTDDGMNANAARYPGKISDSSTSFRNILKGPKVSGDKLINIKKDK